MIIHHPEITQKDGHTIVFSKIKFAVAKEDFPEYLWYKIPDQYAENLSLQSDAFLIPGLLAGMHFGEDIEVRGVVSPKLAYHLDEYQYILHFRMPENVQQVEINYNHLEPLCEKPERIGALFSGGVDSLFTLWKHFPHNETIKGYGITHGLFIMGFDFRFREREKYLQVFRKYQLALDQIGITLISLETNIVQIIIPRLNYPHFYGPILAGSAHALGGLFSRFFIPSSRDYYQLRTWTSSSDPLSDPLLSSDRLNIIHHGAMHRRVEKIAEIYPWKLAQENLRVCFNKEFDERGLNCSRCEKCTRTMVPLYALGALGNFKTFKKPFRKNKDVLWVARKFDPTQGYVPESFSFVREKKPRLLPWLIAATILGYLRYWLLKSIPIFIKKKLHRYGYFVDRLKEKDAFEDPSIIQLIRSQKINQDN
jgi:hypothetical protein